MTQANDLGQIGNQLAANYRTRVNVDIQSIVTQHYGAAEPAPVLPNMMWFSSGDGYIKVRNPTNTGWQTIGTIGPPMKWTNIDTPATGWKTGDVKVSVQGAEAGWIRLDDGTIGDQYSGATNRAHPDTAALFSWLWLAGGLPLYVAGTWTQAGRGASAGADFAAHRHLQTPWVKGRALASEGQGAGLTQRWWLASDGAENVALAEGHMPGHYHTVNIPAHGHPYCVDVAAQNSYNSTGAGGFATGGNSKVVTGVYAGWPDAATDGCIIGAGGAWAGASSWAGSGAAFSVVGPRVYFFFMMKL